jgi:hypothetical protein
MAGPGPARFYSSTAVQTALSGGISAGNNSCIVNSVSGFPASTPFVLSLDQNTISEELILVGGVSGTTLTGLTRGFNGTTAISHNNGASVVHVMCAQDLTDPQVHIGAFDNVHGTAVGSLVVGTNDTQTLANKTLTSPTINTPTITTPTITGTAITGPITSSGLITATDFTPTGLTGAQSASRYVGATGGGIPVSGSFLVGDFVIDNATGIIWICSVAGSPGTWSQMVSQNSTVTMFNKTLSGPAITGGATIAGGLTISGGGAAVTGGITSTGEVQGTDFYSTGLTGATNGSRFAGCTNGGPPTAGTFVLGDFVVDRVNGSLWVCTSGGTPGTWVIAYANGIVGSGQSTNIVTSGANRTSAHQPFHYSFSATTTTGAGGGYALVLNDVTFTGVGSIVVCAGDNTNSLGLVNVIGANTNITTGALHIGGQCFTGLGGSLGSGLVVRINGTVVAW